jgi:hypothetical protein
MPHGVGGSIICGLLKIVPARAQKKLKSQFGGPGSLGSISQTQPFSGSNTG